MKIRISLLVTLLFLATLSFSPLLEAKKNDKIERITVTSLEELLDIDDWSKTEVTIDVPEGTVWRDDEDRKPLKIKKERNFTLDGGEHPPTIYGHALELDSCKNAVFRNLIFRPGSEGFEEEDSEPALYVEDSKSIEFENCSFSWGTNGVVSIKDSDGVEFKECIIAEPLLADRGDNENREFGCVVDNSEDVAFEECLFARCKRGTPAIATHSHKDEVEVKVESSVIFDYQDRGAEYLDSGKDKQKIKLELERNRFVASPEAGPAVYLEPVEGNSDVRVTLSDNLDDEDLLVMPTMTSDDGLDVRLGGVGESSVNVDDLLDRVGPSEHDATDNRILEMVRNRVFVSHFDDETQAVETNDLD